ncbi:MAG: carbamoyltransferase [Acidobacteria bacterium]|nr:carbamoyltransferase [Acidobacteriota bacterium]
MPNAILGISAFYHDSAAAMLVDGEIIAAAHEERFSRKKHDASFPRLAARYVLDEAGLAASDITCVAFYDKPFLKFERLLETYHGFAPSGLRSFLSAIPVWIKEKLFMREMLAGEFLKLGLGTPQVLFPEHHLSHAASAFYPSPFDEAAILTLDGVGEWATSTIGHGRGADITVLRELEFPHSLGLLYSAFTAYLGFRVNSGEYKLMGLAPYGDPASAEVRTWRDAIFSELVDLRDDGSFLLNMAYFNYATGLTMCRNERWQALFGFAPRGTDDEILPHHMNLALAIQQATEEIVFKLADTAHALTGSRHLTLAGGVALNCVANGKLLRRGPFTDIWIQPASGDAGGALGAALAAWHITNGQPRQTPVTPDAMKGAYLGPAFGASDVERMARRFGAVSTRFDDVDALCDHVAALIDAGKVVGWFQGRMEYGPRALGSRSIVGDARNPEMQRRMNLKIKYREGFRPFAPSVLEECISEYFDLDRPSPYMLLVAPVAERRCHPLPENYASRPLYERLYFQRSDLPAITHVDYSARIQSVSRATHERYWRLINAFRRRTGYGVIVNTSFNVRGEPIVCTPTDAYRCFMTTEMDALVIEDFVFDKAAQKPWSEEDRRKYLGAYGVD